MTSIARYSLLLLALVACTDDDPGLPLRLDQEGDPCRSAHGICLDEEEVRECIDNAWVDRSCAESCAERGPAMISTGCAEVDLEILIEGCQCIPAPGACEPGDTNCESETQVSYCDDSQVWVVYGCDEVCAATLATPISTGCRLGEDDVAACWCVAGALTTHQRGDPVPSNR